MPRLREYRRQVSNAGPVNLGGDRIAAGGSQLGRSFRRAGQALDRVADRYIERDLQNQRFKAAKKVNEDQLRLSDEIENLKRTEDPEGKSYVERVKGKIEEFKENALQDDKFDSTFSRDMLRTSYESMGQNFLKNAAQYEIQTQVDEDRRKLESIINRNQNDIYRDPTLLETRLDIVSKLVEESPNLTIQQRERAKEGIRQDMYTRGLRGEVDSFIKEASSPEDVDEFLAELSDSGNKYKVNAEPIEYERAIKKLATFRKTTEVKSKNQLVRSIDQEAKYIQSTGKDRGFFQESFIRESFKDNPDKAELLVDKMNNARRVADFKNGMEGKSFMETSQEIEKTIENRDSDPDNFLNNSEVVSKNVSIFTQELKKFNESPTDYVLEGDESIEALYNDYIETAQNNPEDAEGVQLKFKNYLEASLAKQKVLDPNAIGSVLTKKEISSIKADLSSITEDPKGAQKLVQKMQNLQSMYGEYWPYATKDLMANKAITSEMYVMASMFDRPETQATAEMVAKTIPMNMEKILSLGPISSKKSDFEEKAHSELEDFKASTLYMANGDEIYNNFHKTLTKALAYNEVQGIGADASDIAKDIVNGRYEYVKSVRIPNDQNVNAIEDGMYKVDFELQKMEFQVPQFDAFGLRDEDAQERFRDAVISKGKLVNDNDFGLRLVVPEGPTWREVRKKDKDGNFVPVKFSWDELSKMGLEANSEPIPNKILRARDR